MPTQWTRLGGAILAVAYGAAALAALAAAGDARVLAESDFAWDMDGWEVEGAGARDVAHMSKMVKAGDDGPDTWYFVAPLKFMGAKRDAYGGSLAFRHGFFEFNRSCTAPHRCPCQDLEPDWREQVALACVRKQYADNPGCVQRRQGHDGRIRCVDRVRSPRHDGRASGSLSGLRLQQRPYSRAE